MFVVPVSFLDSQTAFWTSGYSHVELMLAINEEFRRCPAVPLESMLLSQLDRSTPTLLQRFNTKRGAVGQHMENMLMELMQLQKDVFNLPSHDALAQILPLLTRPNINHTYQVHHPHKRPPLHNFEDDSHTAEITDLQTKELENYRSAMSRMAEDMIRLRNRVETLEAENHRLCTDVLLHQDLGRDPLDDADIDVMTKAEIVDRIVNLKFKLASENNKTTSQRDRIQQLQNELIKKNDIEKRLLKLQRINQQQEEELQHQQRRLAKMATLDITVKQQEKVIEKLDKALDCTLSGDKKLLIKMQKDEADCRKEEIVSSLAAENARLRKELERMRPPPARLLLKQPAETKETQPHEEKSSLLNKLEKAEAKITTLEAQLEENAKLWGKQKQEMLTELSEQRRGLVRTPTTTIHNIPSVS